MLLAHAASARVYLQPCFPKFSVVVALSSGSSVVVALGCRVPVAGQGGAAGGTAKQAGGSHTGLSVHLLGHALQPAADLL